MPKEAAEQDFEDISGQVLELPAESEAAEYHRLHPRAHQDGDGETTERVTSNISTSSPSTSTSSPPIRTNPNSTPDPNLSRVRYDEEGISNSPSKSKFRARLISSGSEYNPTDSNNYDNSSPIVAPFGSSSNLSASTRRPSSSHSGGAVTPTTSPHFNHTPSPASSSQFESRDRNRNGSEFSLAPTHRGHGAGSSLHSRDGSLRTVGRGSVRGSAKGSLRMKQRVVPTPGES